METNPAIFRAYDIRGTVGADFDESFAFELGAKIVACEGFSQVIIGRDGRDSSRALAEATARGCERAGARVTVIGECTTPLFYFSVRTFCSGGGIMVTASHNPDKYNGFKVVREGATIVSGFEVQDICRTTAVPGVRHDGWSQTKDYTNAYAERVVQIAKLKRGDGSVGFQGPPALGNILKRLEMLTGMFFDAGQGQGIKAVFDGDGDRIAVFENGVPIPPDFLFLLLVDTLRPATVAYDLRFSRSVKEHLATWGIASGRSRVGRRFIHELMVRIGADLGGEKSGHFYFREFGYLESPELALLYILDALKRSESHSLQELVEPFRRYYASDELSFPRDDGAFTRLRAAYADGAIDTLDGLTVAYRDWWFNLRPSNTEPLMRLVAEADTQALLDAKLKELQSILKR